ncbi:MAG: RCC1 repeat-containing protein [Xanthomonadales bacterium]|nr:RCC1 repeat-containing protein [Xanthomonadales bacterium]
MACFPSAQAQTPLNDILKIAAGGGHNCGLTTGGGVKCWGANFGGQLGDGTIVDRLTAVDVSGLSSGVSAITAGFGYSCGLTTGGGVKCWGSNFRGQLGDGTTSDRLTAVDVSGLSSGVSAIAAGSSHTCALTTDGGVKCWGNNVFGQIGDGSITTSRLTAVDVIGLGSGVIAIAAGQFHTCALTTGGGVKCWGLNMDGRLGDGTTTSRSTAVDVSGLSSGVSAIAAGETHTCALTTGGAVKCWGRNGFAVQSLTPVDVSGLESGVSAIAAGRSHTCVLITGGGVKCWGSNFRGQLGDGTTSDRLTAVDVSGLSSGVNAIAAGQFHTCALTTSGGVKCWGDNFYGQLGDDTTAVRSTAVDASGLGSGVNSTAAGDRHSCALTTGGGVKCWGSNNYGQLGDGTDTARRAAVDVNGLGSGVIAIAVGGIHTCALTTGGGVKCWGSNLFGRLGDGTSTDHWTAVDVSGLGSGVSAIAAGDRHTCALTTGGGVKCWGDNVTGQLGDGTVTNRLTAVDVSGLGNGVSAIAAGGIHSCALTTGGGVKCWGSNFYGQLGDGSTTNGLTAVDVSGLGSGVIAIAAGGIHSCALTTGGGVKCWGHNFSGRLGDGTTTDRLTAVDVSGLSSGVSAVAAGSDHTCALTTGGGVKCWGYNRNGQLGDGTTIDRLTAVDVSALSSGVNAIASGSDHTCALTSGGGVKCWGSHQNGQLGIGGRNYGLPGDVLMSDFVFFNGFENEP